LITHSTITLLLTYLDWSIRVDLGLKFDVNLDVLV